MPHINNEPDGNSFPPLRLLLTGWTVLFLCYFPVGYQNAVLNASTDVFLDFINTSYTKRGYKTQLSVSGVYTLYSVIVSLWQIGCIFGSLLSCKLEDKIGRKRSLLTVSSSIQMFGSFLMVISIPFDTFELLAIGRFVTGLSSGVVCPTLRVFLCECCPDAYRGYLNGPGGFGFVALAQPAVLGSPDRISFLLAACIVPSIAQLLISPCVPQSPKYLYIEKGDSARAVKSIFFYHGNNANVAKLFREYELEKRLADDQLPFTRAIRTKIVLIPVLLSAAISLAHSSHGIDVLEAYSTQIFTQFGMKTKAAKEYSILVNAPGVLGGVLAILVGDRVGRRPLLLSTMALAVSINLLFIVMGLISRSYGYHPTIGAALVTATGIQAFFYSLGPGAVGEALFAEISPHNVRAVIGALSEFLFWLTTSIYVFAFPPLLLAIGPYSFLSFTLPLALGLLYLAIALPETSGKSVMKIVEDLNEDNGPAGVVNVDSTADFLPFIGSTVSTASSRTDILSSLSTTDTILH